MEREEGAWGWRAASLDSVSPPIRHFYIFSYKSTSGLMSTSLVSALLWLLSAGMAGFWFVCSTSWPSTSRFRPVTWLAATSVRLPVSLRDLTPPRPFAWSPPRAPGRGEREGPRLQHLVFHFNSNHSSWRPLGFLPPCRAPLAKTRRNAFQTVVRAFFRPQTVQLVGCGLQKAVCRLRRLRMSLWRPRGKEGSG